MSASAAAAAPEEEDLFPKITALETLFSDVFTKARNVLIAAVEGDQGLEDACTVALAASGELRNFLTVNQNDPVYAVAIDNRDDIVRTIAELTVRARQGTPGEGEAAVRRRLVPMMGQLNSMFGNIISTTRDTEMEAKFPKAARIPVLVITGFLGAGKTTLLNYILTANHGKRIAVIENEFGEIGIDDKLIAAANKVKTDEDIVETMNGCLCCTVRSDLVKVLFRLLEKKAKFDFIIIETTGMADPGPVAQTFFANQRLSYQLRLDGIVTLVDAFHVKQHLDDVKPDGAVNEAIQQVAFADRILLNKIDLVTPEELLAVEEQIRSINSTATIFRTQRSRVDLTQILDLRSFDLARILQMEEDAGGGISFLRKGTEDHSDDSDCEEHDHHHHHDTDAERSACGDCHEHEDKHKHEKKAHRHGSGVGSMSVFFDGWRMDMRKLNAFFSQILKERGPDIFRMKGVVAIEGMDEKFVFQGVHSVFDGAPLEPWGTMRPSCTLVFIGRNLDKPLIEGQLRECLSSSISA
jgi:G3E family GTPase